MSRMLSGLSRLSSSRMPSDSSWNTPLASPFCSSSYVSWSSSGRLIQVDLDAARLLDEPDGVVKQRQRAQAEEVHLEQADLLEVAHDPLRRDHGLALLRAGVVALAHRRGAAARSRSAGRWR